MEKQTSKYRWVVFTAVLFTYLLIVSQRTAPGLISDQLMKDFSITASTIGLLTSIQFLAYAGLQIPVGILSDRYGPNLLLIIGALLNGLGTFIYSLAQDESILMLARLMVGMGDATIWVNVVLILSQWFRVNEFVKLLGFAGMSGSLGFLMATFPFSAWISATSWRQPFMVTGIILCLCALLLYIVLVKKPKGKLIESPATVKTGVKIVRQQENLAQLLKRIFSNRQAWATFFCHFGAMGTYVGFIGSWAVPYGMHIYNMSRSHASQLIMVGIFGALIGGPLISWISSRLEENKRPYIVIHMMIFLSWLCFPLLNGKPPIYLLLILFFLIGFGNGSSSLTFAVVRKSFPMKEVGVVSGFANTGGFISAVLLPSIFGKVLDHFHAAPALTGYHYGLVIPVVFSFIGLIGGFLIKEQREKVKQTSESLV